MLGRDNGDGTHTIYEYDALYEVSWDDIRELNDRFMVEEDPVKISLKLEWMKYSVWLKKVVEGTASVPDDNHFNVLSSYTSSIEQTLMKTIPTDPDVLFFLNKFGTRFDGKTWEDYQSSLLESEYHFTV